MLLVINGFLCLAALVFPFSVAATNVTLGIALVLGIVSGLWWMGAKQLWCEFHSLCIVFVAYFVLLLAGLIWSHDPHRGAHVVAGHWFWLLVPVVVAVGVDKKWQQRILQSFSAGLILNLIFCVLQVFGYVETNSDGSNAMDATGHIGHIGFGFVYGIWAAWLVHLGYYRREWQRWVCWGLAAWSYVMVFLAQGRAGQVVAAVLFLCVLFRILRSYIQSVRLAILVILIGVMGLSAMLVAGGDRWQQFVLEVERFTMSEQVAAKQMLTTSTGQRIYMLKVSLNIWREHPVLGVGTGGLPASVKQWQQNHDQTPVLLFVHPHNQYMLDFVRWGLAGLLCLLLMLVLWIRDGWRMDWRESAAVPLVFLTAMALAVDGMFGPTLEEHFSGVLVALLLGLGLSIVRSGTAGDIEK